MTNTFTPLISGTYLFTCALPLNLDSYRYCQFQCEYCFMRNRVIGTLRDENSVPNIPWLQKKFHRIYDMGEYNNKNLVDVMLRSRIDIHLGTKSDPFQPREKQEQYTKQIMELCNQYQHHLVITTKSDSYYDCNVDPDLHSFQFSITNHVNDKYLEPNVPEFSRRVDFYNRLKDEGFKVGIRFEPYIPNVTDVPRILEYFEEPDIVHIAKLNLMPQVNHDKFLRHIGCSRKQFTTHGKTHMKLDILYEQYLKEVFDYLEENGYSYSARNALIGNNNCCCGDKLIHKTNTFDPVHLVRKYGKNYTLEDALCEMKDIRQCSISHLYTSNRRLGGGRNTAEDYYKDRWNKRTSKFNPKFFRMKSDGRRQSTLEGYL